MIAPGCARRPISGGVGGPANTAAAAASPRPRCANGSTRSLLLLVLLLLISISARATSAERAGCAGLLADYYAALAERTPEPFEPRGGGGGKNASLVFFLHIPRCVCA
jgi:hypothetical protein